MSSRSPLLLLDGSMAPMLQAILDVLSYREVLGLGFDMQIVCSFVDPQGRGSL